MSVGVASIDADHRLLISLMAHLDSAVQEKNVIGSALLSLAAYTDYHFSREEKIMTVCCDPALANHKALHDQLRSDVMGICRKYENCPEDVDFDTRQIFLRDWLVEHILGTDTKMKPYIQANLHEVELIGEMPLIDIDAIENAAVSEESQWPI